MNVKIKFRHPGYLDQAGNWHYTGSICEIYLNDEPEPAISGQTVLSKKDRFSRPRGRGIAFARAFNSITDKNLRLEVYRAAHPNWIVEGRDYLQ